MFTTLRHQNCDEQAAYAGQATGILYTRDAKPIWGKLGILSFFSLNAFYYGSQNKDRHTRKVYAIENWPICGTIGPCD